MYALRRNYAGLQGRREDVCLCRYGEFRAWHSSKKHWNDIRTTGDLPDAFIRAQIRNSYLLVLRQNVTPKSLREEILASVGEHGLPE